MLVVFFLRYLIIRLLPGNFERKIDNFFICMIVFKHTQRMIVSSNYSLLWHFIYRNKLEMVFPIHFSWISLLCPSWQLLSHQSTPNNNNKNGERGQLTGHDEEGATILYNENSNYRIHAFNKGQRRAGFRWWVLDLARRVDSPNSTGRVNHLGGSTNVQGCPFNGRNRTARNMDHGMLCELCISLWRFCRCCEENQWCNFVAVVRPKLSSQQ